MSDERALVAPESGQQPGVLRRVVGAIGVDNLSLIIALAMIIIFLIAVPSPF